jgi:AbrB family looped-hinge helix DNA binding protein
METKLDKFGRVVIPKEVRDQCGIGPGTVLEVESAGEQIVLKPARGGPRLAMRNGILVFTGKVEGDLVDIVGAIRKEREERIRKFLPSEEKH